MKTMLAALLVATSTLAVAAPAEYITQIAIDVSVTGEVVTVSAIATPVSYRESDQVRRLALYIDDRLIANVVETPYAAAQLDVSAFPYGVHMIKAHAQTLGGSTVMNAVKITVHAKEST